MTINWENIKYLFQIPLDWFRTIHNKVFHAYGTNFIRVRNGDDGGMHIDVDENTFAQQVLEVTGGGSGGGTVKSVDGVAPDSEGNVPLGAIRSINSHYYPDANGNIDVGLGVASVNGEMPDANGNVDLGSIVNTVNGTTPDANGNVNVGTVRAVNGNLPVAGNVDLGTIIWSVDGVGNVNIHDLQLSAVRSVNDKTVDANYNVDLGDIVNSVNGIAPDADGNVALRVVATIDNKYPDDNGNINLSGYVKTVNNIAPDINGNVQVTAGISSVNNIEPVNGNVDLGTIVNSVNDIEPDDSGNVELNCVETVNGISPINGDVDLGDIVNSVNGIAPDQNGNVELDYVQTVDDILPVEGNIAFPIVANQWLKADSSGHIASTNEKPVVLSSGNTGYIYAQNGNVVFKNDEYVTLSTDQTITGKKIFDAVQTFNSAYGMTNINGSAVALSSSSSLPLLNLIKNGNTGSIAKTDSSLVLTDTSAIFADAPVGEFGNNAAFVKWDYNTVRLSASLAVNNFCPIFGVDASNAIVLSAPPNNTFLLNSPDERASNKAVATCGWVKDNFTPSMLTGGNKWVKTNADGTLTTTDEEPFILNNSSTGFLYNNNGTPSYLPFGNGPNTVAVGNHTHNTSQLNNDAGFITTPQAKTLIESYDYTTPTDVEDIVDGYDFVTEDDLEGYVTIGTEQNITGKKIFGPNASSGLEVYGDANANHLHFNRNLEITGLGTKSFNVRCYNNQGQEGNMGLYAGSYTQFYATVTAATIVANAWAAMRIGDGNGGYPVGCYFDNASKTARVWSSGGYSRMSYRDSSGNDIAYLHIDQTSSRLKHGTGGVLEVDGNGFKATVGSNTYIEGGNSQLSLTCGNTSSPSINLDNSTSTILLKSGNTGGHISSGGDSLALWGGNASSVYAGERIAIQWGSYPHVWIDSNAEVQLKAPANQSKLYTQPTVAASDTNSYAIATCGWVANNFIRSESSTYTGTRTVVTGVTWTGTQLQFTRENWKYTKGQLESVTAASAITINTTTYP